MKKQLVIGYLIVALLFMAPVSGNLVASEPLKAYELKITPTLDGDISEAEWEDTELRHYIFQNDSSTRGLICGLKFDENLTWMYILVKVSKGPYNTPGWLFISVAYDWVYDNQTFVASRFKDAITMAFIYGKPQVYEEVEDKSYVYIQNSTINGSVSSGEKDGYYIYEIKININELLPIDKYIPLSIGYIYTSSKNLLSGFPIPVKESIGTDGRGAVMIFDYYSPEKKQTFVEWIYFAGGLLVGISATLLVTWIWRKKKNEL